MPLPTLLPNGKSVTTGTLELIKEEVSTDQSTDLKEEPIAQDSTYQDNNNKQATENQESWEDFSISDNPDDLPFN